MIRALHRLLAWERVATGRLTLAPSSRWRWLASVGAHLGDGPLWLAIGAGTLILGTPYWRRIALFAALAVLVTTAVATAIKYWVRRPRPNEQPQFYSLRHDRYSFPSGHATRVAAIATVVGHFEPSLAPAGYVLAVIVSLCRILVGVHYLSDVLAGLLIGWLGAWGALLAIR